MSLNAKISVEECNELVIEFEAQDADGVVDNFRVEMLENWFKRAKTSPRSGGIKVESVEKFPSGSNSGSKVKIRLSEIIL